MSHFSLTKRGYVVKKKNITERDIKKIERDLTFQPLVNPVFAELKKPKRFSTLLESKLRYYLPRYYGYKNFGPPIKNTLINTGEAVDFEVFWDLLPHQEKAWAQLSHHLIENKMGGILSLPCGYGKCLGKDTPVLMYDGEIKMVQDIVKGDLLMGDDSTSREVLSICSGRELLYRIIPEYGDSYVVNQSHILSLTAKGQVSYKGRAYEIGDKLDLGVTDYLDMDQEKRDKFMGYRVPVRFDAREIVGNSWDIAFKLEKDDYIPMDYKCNSRDIQMEILSGIIDAYGYFTKRGCIFKLGGSQLGTDLKYLSRSLGYFVDEDEGEIIVHGDMSNLDLRIKEKISYRNGEMSTRIEIKVEIEDGEYYGFEIDGNRRFILGDFQVTHNTFVSIKLGSVLKKKMLVIVNKEFLMRQWQEAITKCSNASIGIIQRNKIDVEGKDIVIGMLQSISMKDYPEHIFEKFGYVVVDECFPYEQHINTDMGPIKIGELFKMWEKAEDLPKVLSYNEKTTKFEYKSITHAWKKESKKLIRFKFSKNTTIKCTENHLLLTDSGWKKAKDISIGELVKSFSPDNNFCYAKISEKNIITYPDAISVFDIEVEENHNFIPCSENKGTGIIAHNCHHISSECFSKALPKIATLYTLGLSATPIRKDGLTEVFLNYLGPIIHKERRNTNNEVWIKQIVISSLSEHYDLEIMKVTGTKDTGKMITNISKYETMNRFLMEICRVLVQDEERPRKVLVLGARREQLEWLHEAWEDLSVLNYQRKYATGGLYYGNQRMNKKEYYKMLDESKNCDIIWGTMDIAKEGLDIPDRNTLILLNGGHEVEQAVGRILRKFHKDTPPTVIDLIYNCGNFPKHATSRRDYYESENYYIQKLKVEINDDDYSTASSKLEKYLKHYPSPGDPSILKKLARNKKKEIPLGNHPPELESIRIGSGGPSLIPKKKPAKVEKKSIPVKAAEGGTSWRGQYDSDEDHEGLTNGHLSLLSENIDNEESILEIDSHGHISVNGVKVGSGRESGGIRIGSPSSTKNKIKTPIKSSTSPPGSTKKPIKTGSSVGTRIGPSATSNRRGGVRVSSAVARGKKLPLRVKVNKN